MANRTAKFVSGIVATVLAGAPLTTLPRSAAGAPDQCLSKPSGETPQGQHWYYRIDHANNNRQCWYLRAEGDKAAQPAPDASAQAGSPATDGTARRSIQDAHAEFPAPLPAANRAPATGAPAQQAPPAAANPVAAAAASRAPEASEQAEPPAEPAPLVQTLADAQPVGTAAPSPAVAPADAAAAKPHGSLQTLLLVIAGALALAGLIASIVFRLGAARRRAYRDLHWSERANPDAADDATDDLAFERGTAPWERKMERFPASADLPREADQPAEHPADPDIDQITALLEELVKQGPKLDRTISAIEPADYGQSRPGQPGVPA